MAGDGFPPSRGMTDGGNTLAISVAIDSGRSYAKVSEGGNPISPSAVSASSVANPYLSRLVQWMEDTFQ